MVTYPVEFFTTYSVGNLSAVKEFSSMMLPGSKVWKEMATISAFE